jgi:hypothetical protein
MSIPYLFVLNGARNRRCVVVMWLQMQMVSSRVHAAWRQHLAVHRHTQYCDKPSRGTERNINWISKTTVLLLPQGREGELNFPYRSSAVKELVYLSLSFSPAQSYITPTLFYHKKGGNLIPTHPPIDCPPSPLPTRCIFLRLLPAHHFLLSICLCGPVPCLW